MKSYTLRILAIGLLTFLAGCERELDTLGVTTKITFFPVFDMQGEPEMLVPAGADLTLPEVSATEQGDEIPVTTTINGTYFKAGVNEIDTSQPDTYVVVYSAINKDGFPGSVSRTVYVAPPTGDLVNSMEGLYTATVGRDGPPTAEYTDMKYVYVTKTDDNTYELTDIIGGYYDLGRAYGAAYAAPVSVIANNISANDFTFSEPIGIGPFEGSAEITAMNVDADAGTITYKATWEADAETTYAFDITLTQVK